MTIEECYAAMGADYEDVLRRLVKEERVKRFLLLLPKDPSFETLCRALEEKNAEEAFRAAHSLKGICMNLGLTELRASAEALTEALRGAVSGSGSESGIGEEVPRLFEQVRRDYQRTMDLIRELA